MTFFDLHSEGWQRLLRVLPDEIIIIDSKGVIQFARECFAELSGYSCAELVGQPVEMLVSPSNRVQHVKQRQRYGAQPKFRSMGENRSFWMLCKDGREVSMMIALSPITVDGAGWVVVAANDAHWDADLEASVKRERFDHTSSRLASAALLADSEQRFRLAFEENMAPMVFTDLEDRAIAANHAFCDLTGFSMDEVLGFDSKLFTFSSDVGITEEVHDRMSAGNLDRVRYVKRYRHKNGRVLFVEVSKSPARDESGRTLYYLISECDVTARVHRDRLLELLSEVNRLASAAVDEARFLQQLCEALVDKGGFKLAWIGIPSTKLEGAVHVLCSAGEVDYLYEGLVSWNESEESGQGPTGVALRTGESQVVGNLATDSIFTPWRERAEKFGLGSSVAIPSVLEGEVAVLNLYDPHVYAFDDVTLRGLEDLVEDARFAVAHVRSVQETRLALERATSANQALKESEQRFRLAFEENMAPMIFTDFDDHAIAANGAFCDMIGFSREELLGQDSKHFTLPDDVGITEETHQRLVSNAIDQVRYIKRYLRRDGRIVFSEVSRSVARNEDGVALYFVSSERDVTAERTLTEELSHQALHDSLTGLANRALFEDRLIQANVRLARDGGFGTVLLMDLDDFKGVNDTFGHQIGDELLVGIARRLELVTRASDTVCRLGSDQFLYLAEGLDSLEHAEEMAARLLEVLYEPFTFSGLVIEQHATIGLVVIDSTESTGLASIQEADVALYEAKKYRRGSYLVFSPIMHEEALARFSLLQELRHALHVGELAMHFQPIVNLHTNEVVGFEALMRWRHPVQGWIPPDTFIALAEQSELIVDLGAFALDEALRAASMWAWANEKAPRPYVTVNFSARQFHDPGLIKGIAAALERNGVGPERLIIEITESVALHDAAETMNTMAQLHEMGVGIALDDFGTGYSSLAYLALWLPGVIKIDRSFVSPSFESDHTRVVLEAIISLGRKLNTVVLAEGIETRAQLGLLRDLGCQMGQGYLFSCAMPPEEVLQLMIRPPGNWWGDDLHFQPHLGLTDP